MRPSLTSYARMRLKEPNVLENLNNSLLVNKNASSEYDSSFHTTSRGAKPRIINFTLKEDTTLTLT